jgi:tRNA 2-thiouridine synthesizing protein A
MPDSVLDAKGLMCPLPVLRARKVLNGMAAGELLTVLATDPSSVQDFDAFCRQTGHELVESAGAGEGVFRYLIRKRR